MNKKKSVLLILAAGLLTISGCTKQEDTYRESLVIDVYDSLTDYEGMQTGWYAQVLEEKFQLQLNFLDKSQEDSLKQADIVVCNYEDVSPQELISKGYLLNLETLLEEGFMENSELLDYRDSYEYWNGQLVQEGVYVLPTHVSRLSKLTPSEENIPTYGMYLNWEAYENINMPDIDDMEEFLDVLEEMQKAGEAEGISKDGILLYTDDDTDLLDHITLLMGAMGGLREGFLINTEGKHEELLDKDSLYLNALEWLREAYHRGLIPEDSDELSQEQVMERYQKGQVLLSLQPQENVGGYALAPVEDMKIVSYGCNPLGHLEQYVGISAHAEDPDRILEFIGWLYSTEGIMLSGTETDLKAAGPLGLTWKMEDGNPVLTEFGEQVFAKQIAVSFGGTKAETDTVDVQMPAEWGAGTWQQGTCKLNLQTVTTVEVSPSGFAYNYTLWNTTIDHFTNSDASWQERMEALEPMEYLIDHNRLAIIPSYAPDTMVKSYDHPQEIVDKRAACRQVIVDYSWKMIRAESEEQSRKLLKEMKIELLSVGYEEVLEYDREWVSAVELP